MPRRALPFSGWHQIDGAALEPLLVLGEGPVLEDDGMDVAHRGLRYLHLPDRGEESIRERRFFYDGGNQDPDNSGTPRSNRGVLRSLLPTRQSINYVLWENDRSRSRYRWRRRESNPHLPIDESAVLPLDHAPTTLAGVYSRTPGTFPAGLEGGRPRLVRSRGPMMAA